MLAAVAPIIKIPQPSQPEPEIPAAQVPEFKTEPNSFGIYRIYKSGEPSFTPDDNFHVANVSNGPNFIQDPPQARSTWASPFGVGITAVDPPADSKNTPGYLPFKNMTIFHLMQWFYDSSLTKSLGTLNDLVHKVLLAPDFDPKDFNGFDVAREARQLNDDENSSTPATSVKDGWIEMTVPISVPCNNVSHPSEVDAPVFHVKGLMYRKPLEVIKAAFENPSAELNFTFPPTRNTGKQDPIALLNTFTLNFTIPMPSFWNTKRFAPSRKMDVNSKWSLQPLCSHRTTPT